MQWRMLGRRGRHASWTIVGDPAQSAWAGDEAEVIQARDAALGGRRRSEYTLSTNYRNSAEIFALAARVVRQVLPETSLPRAVRSTGVQPEHVVTDRLARATRAAAAELLTSVEGTVGAIAAVGPTASPTSSTRAGCSSPSAPPAAPGCARSSIPGSGTAGWRDGTRCSSRSRRRRSLR